MLKATSINPSTNFLEGTILLFNKPIEWSSFDLVKKIRSTIKKSYNLKKIKVGHAGTLDPLADGLLIVCTGKFTKKISVIQNYPKKYIGTMFLGATTASNDLETEINKRYPTSHINDDLIHGSCNNFKGLIYQKPPIFSALKKNGKRLFEYARKGESVKIKSRQVHVKGFKITNIKMPEIDFEVTCSKGTYIRSLVRDYGHHLNSGALLKNLTRTDIGPFNLSNAYTIEQFTEHIFSNLT